jgi:hypothetical protein
MVKRFDFVIAYVGVSKLKQMLCYLIIAETYISILQPQ